MSGVVSCARLPLLHALSGQVLPGQMLSTHPLAQTGTGNAPGFRFVDVTEPAGIHFRHNSGAYGGKLLPETLGSGCAFLDYDGDGWQDILLINGMDWPDHEPRKNDSANHKTQRSTLRLYHNNGNGTFTDVTARAGLDLDKIMRGEPGAQRRDDAAAGQQHRPAVGMHVRGPKRRGTGFIVRHVLVRRPTRK